MTAEVKPNSGSFLIDCIQSFTPFCDGTYFTPTEVTAFLSAGGEEEQDEKATVSDKSGKRNETNRSRDRAVRRECFIVASLWILWENAWGTS